METKKTEKSLTTRLEEISKSLQEIEAEIQTIFDQMDASPGIARPDTRNVMMGILPLRELNKHAFNFKEDNKQFNRLWVAALIADKYKNQ